MGSQKGNGNGLVVQPRLEAEMGCAFGKFVQYMSYIKPHMIYPLNTSTIFAAG
jgi:hypothetical protein